MQPVTQQKTQGWIDSIDGLRAISVLAVIFHHTNSQSISNWALGNVGVAIFFSISGFLAYYVLLRDERRFGRIDYNYFLWRRVLRIWPAYVFVIVLAYVLKSAGGAPILPLFTFSLNWELALFRPWPHHYLPHLWSIAVEEQFYILAPFMYWALRARYWLKFCLAVFVLSNLGRITWMAFLDHPATQTNGGLYYASLTYADTFVAGALIAKFFTDGWEPSKIQQIICFLAGAALLVLLLRLWAKSVFPPYSSLAAVSYALPPFASALLLASVVPADWRSPVRWLLSVPFVRYLGTLSYSLYLTHLMALHIARHAFPTSSKLLFNFAVLLTCILLAQVSYYAVERPFLAIKKKGGGAVFEFATRTRLPTVLTWTAILAGAALFVLR